MEIITNEKSGYYVNVEFKVSADEFNEQVNKVYNRRKGSITVQGFRKGKATRTVIERVYGKDVFYGDAVNELFTKLSPDVEKEIGIEALDIEPNADAPDADGAILYKVKYTVKPDTSVENYKGVSLEVKDYTVSDKDVDDEIERQRRKTARIADLETPRPAENGDTVIFDFTGSADGAEFEGGSAENFKLDLGSGKFIPGFEEQIVGHSVGDDFDVNVTFPEEYAGRPELAGKPALFKCRINGIQEHILDDFDDDFVKDVSEFETVAEYTADIRERLIAQADLDREIELREKANDKVAELVTADLPQVMIEREIDRLAVSTARNYESQGLNFMGLLSHMGKTVKDFRDDLYESAVEFVKCRLGYEKIAEYEGLTVTDEDMEEQYAKLAESGRVSVEEVKKSVNENDLRDDTLCEKAHRFVIDNAVITTVTAA